MTKEVRDNQPERNQWSWDEVTPSAATGGYGQFHAGSWQSPSEASQEGASSQESAPAEVLFPGAAPTAFPTRTAATPKQENSPIGSSFSQIQPGIIPLRPLSTGDIFNATFQAIRQAPAVMLGVVIAIWAFFSLLTGLFMQWVFPEQTDLLNDIMQDTTAAPSIESLLAYLEKSLLLSIPLTMLELLLTGITAGICVAAIASLVLGRRPSPADAWATVKGHIFPIVLYGLLLFTITAVSIGIAVIPIVGIAASLGADQLGATLGAAGISLLLLLAVTIFNFFILIRLLFTVPALVMENISLKSGLKRSWTLTKGSFWRITGIMALVILLLGIVMGLLSSVIGVISGIVMVSTQSVTGLMAVSTIISMVLYGLYTPFLAGVEALLYIDARMRKEGLALALLRATQDEQ